jgi:hypothetical protein
MRPAFGRPDGNLRALRRSGAAGIHASLSSPPCPYHRRAFVPRGCWFFAVNLHQSRFELTAALSNAAIRVWRLALSCCDAHHKKRGAFVFLSRFLARASDGDVMTITVLMILPRYMAGRKMKRTPSYQPIVAHSKSNMV